MVPQPQETTEMIDTQTRCHLGCVTAQYPVEMHNSDAQERPGKKALGIYFNPSCDTSRSAVAVHGK